MTLPSNRKPGDIITDEHGNKYIYAPPTDDGYRSMRQLYIESVESYKKELANTKIPLKRKRVLEIVDSIEALTVGIAQIDDYFRAKVEADKDIKFQ